ncbi:MAG: hypothetical protein KC496_00745 [Anaerolineae bacterium]|nr:hypothetical protein [Anaerolineae bacterium]
MKIIYIAATGEIKARAMMSDTEATANLAEGDAWLETDLHVSDLTHYVSAGALVEFPAKPTNLHVWDWATKVWNLPESALEDAAGYARQAIDSAAGAARARYLTIAPGQDATYAAKYADAIAYVDAAYPVDTAPYPWIAAEANSTGLAPQAAADRIKAIGDYWGRVKGPQIESTRIAGKDALLGMETVEQIDAHRETVINQLNSM